MPESTMDKEMTLTLCEYIINFKLIYYFIIKIKKLFITIYVFVRIMMAPSY